MLGPSISKLHPWVTHRFSDQSTKNIHAYRELVLLESISQFSHLFGNVDNWRLCTSLFKLIDELEYQNVNITESLQDFQEQVKSAYQISDPDPEHYGFETKLVHTLWLAWQQQLQDMQAHDNTHDYVSALRRSIKMQLAGQSAIIIGLSEFRQCEIDWVKAMLAAQSATLITCAEKGFEPHCYSHLIADDADTAVYYPDELDKHTVISPFFSTVFNYQSASLKQRSTEFRQDHPVSPVQSRFSVYEASSGEQEATAIALQIRIWLHKGYKNLGIVIEDRKLARRVRAILERFSIAIEDLAGWTLSTTSAATVIEKWLECIESDFAYSPLLDFLKSPFIDLNVDSALFAESVYRLENDIMFQENIGYDLDRYIAHIQYRHERLGWSSDASEVLITILKQLNDTQKPLARLSQSGKHPSLDYITELKTCLQKLGIDKQYQNDEAGKNILLVLEQMLYAVKHYPVEISWTDFRSWLAGLLEAAHFNPKIAKSHVKLMSLSQSRQTQFERLIIAGNEQNHIPGKPEFSPFFNNRVRHELGLITWQDKLKNKLHDYRRLLESTLPPYPSQNSKTDYHILFTKKIMENGEEVAPSPWLEAIQVFHTLTYQDSLKNTCLDSWQQILLASEQSADTAPADTYPDSTIQLTPSQLPRTFSASSHQQLIDCPYLYFCSRILKLETTDEIKETLSKSDYGHRIHQCLQAFHAQVFSMPPPFSMTINDENRTSAIQHLKEISAEVFRKDLENNFQHRSWLYRWNKIIPEYIDWQIKRSSQFTIEQTEVNFTRQISDTIEIHGRLDRIDKSTDNRLAIVDYKTGLLPKLSDITSGEATQLIIPMRYSPTTHSRSNIWH